MNTTFQQFSQALTQSGLMQKLSPELMNALKEQYQNASAEELEKALLALNKSETAYLQRQKETEDQKMKLATEIKELVGKEQQEMKEQKLVELKKLEEQSKDEESKILDDLLNNLN